MIKYVLKCRRYSPKKSVPTESKLERFTWNYLEFFRGSQPMMIDLHVFLFHLSFAQSAFALLPLPRVFCTTTKRNRLKSSQIAKEPEFFSQNPQSRPHQEAASVPPLPVNIRCTPVIQRQARHLNKCAPPILLPLKIIARVLRSIQCSRSESVPPGGAPTLQTRNNFSLGHQLCQLLVSCLLRLYL